MMIIDEHMSIDADAGGAPARALQSSLLHEMGRLTADHDFISASLTLSSLRRWLWRRTFAVSVDAADVSLAGVGTHEAAIAKVEQYLHGSHEMRSPVDPHSHLPFDL